MAEDVVDVEVVVVGAGIAGSASAARLADRGLGVLVLEQQTAFRDRVRGETIVPWGVREVVALGLEEVLLGAGGSYASAFIPYDETLEPASAEAAPIPLAMVAPDVSGQLNVGHPEASEALAAHAAAMGADVRRGVTDVAVQVGDAPEVTWTEDGSSRSARCRLVVGADGRTSTVRRQIGIALEERPAEIFGAGLLVRTPDGLVCANASEPRATTASSPSRARATSPACTSWSTSPGSGSSPGPDGPSTSCRRIGRRASPAQRPTRRPRWSDPAVAPP
jgi:2-polyprenyl-6-methoxyphenol hydroxylase-like FAD-dependent oxidoreductase